MKKYKMSKMVFGFLKRRKNKKHKKTFEELSKITGLPKGYFKCEGCQQILHVSLMKSPFFFAKEGKPSVSFLCESCSESQKIKESMKEVFKVTKNIKLGMKDIKKIKGKLPNHMYYQDIKNSKEFKWRNWALHFSLIGEYKKAIKYCDKGIKINPKSAYLFYMRGRSKGDTGKFKEGIKDLNKAIKLNPKFVDAYVERGYIRQKMGDNKGALEDYKKARQIEPSILLPNNSEINQ